MGSFPCCDKGERTIVVTGRDTEEASTILSCSSMVVNSVCCVCGDEQTESVFPDKFVLFIESCILVILSCFCQAQDKPHG